MDGRSGVRYYSNIITYTHSGIHRTESSDGFVLDSDPPIKGVVYDGPGDFNFYLVSATKVHEYMYPNITVLIYPDIKILRGDFSKDWGSKRNRKSFSVEFR